MPTVYLNGEFLPLEEARISPLDRGFLFGDAVYEVIAVYDRKCFCEAEHMQRLQRSLDAVEIKNPLSGAQWHEVFEKLNQDGDKDQLIYMQVTRGAQSARSHHFDRNMKPTVFAMTMKLPKVKTEGVSAITLQDPRWDHCYIKSINLLPNILLYQKAHEQGATECILLRDNIVSEGTSSNVFVVKDDVIATPPNQDHILPGITRQHIIGIAEAHGLNVREAEISATALEEADEIWLTSTSKELTPVIELNNSPVGLGKPGPIWHTMYQYYQSSKK